MTDLSACEDRVADWRRQEVQAIGAAIAAGSPKGSKMTDQDHIDALSEPVKDALRRLHKFNDTGFGVGTTVSRYDIALIPKPSPKRDMVEELAAELRDHYSPVGDAKPFEFAVRFLLKRGLLTLPEGGAG